MTALIGFKVNDPERLACLLHRYRRETWIRRADGIHGWGVGQHIAEDTLLRILPGSLPQDVSLNDLMGERGTRTLLSHASLSVPSDQKIADIQPFRSNQWLFTHGGTLDLGDGRREEMLSALPQSLLSSRKGSMDGEILFLHFMAALQRHRLVDEFFVKPEELALCMLNVIKAAGSSISILATNGQVLLSYSAASPLVYCLFEGLEDCQLCTGSDTYKYSPQLLRSHRQFKGICVTSHPFGTSETWHELPEGKMLIANSTLEFEIIPGPE